MGVPFCQQLVSASTVLLLPYQQTPYLYVPHITSHTTRCLLCLWVTDVVEPLKCKKHSDRTEKLKSYIELIQSVKSPFIYLLLILVTVSLCSQYQKNFRSPHITMHLFGFDKFLSGYSIYSNAISYSSVWDKPQKVSLSLSIIILILWNWVI